MERPKVTNQKWTAERFRENMERVRSYYPTGRDVDMDEAVEYHRKMPERRNLVRLETKARNDGRVLICIRHGEATVAKTLETLEYARDNGGADFVRVFTDTYTRRMEFDKAKKTLEESERVGKSLLNGLPCVAYGVAANRGLYEGIDLPVSTSCTAARTELPTFIMLAAGASESVANAVNGLSFCDASLEDLITDRQFVDGLVGWYEERGIPIFRAIKMTGALLPPSIRVAGMTIGVLLAAEQGVKHFSLPYVSSNCVIQDIAAQRVARNLSQEYLTRWGYDGDLVQGFCQYSGPHPVNRGQAFAYVVLAAATAEWGGATTVEIRSVDEALGLTTKESLAMSSQAARQMLHLLRNQRFAESEEYATEYRIIESEARAILEKALELGDGDIAVGAVKAIEVGTLDFPYVTNTHVLGKARSVRDAGRAVRFLDVGNLPFNEEIREFHRRKVSERKQAEKKEDYELVAEDLTGEVASTVAGA